MTINSVSPIRSLRNAICMLLLVACDTFREEVLIPETAVTFRQNSYFVLPGSSIVIDLESVIEHSLTSVSLTVSQPPTKGTLTQLDPFLLKYTPNGDFREGADQFVFSAVLDNGSTLKSETMNIFMKDAVGQIPCDAARVTKVYAVEDQVPTKGIGIVAIDPVGNDRVCDEGLTNFYIHLNPKFGDAEIVGDSIFYRPGPSFSGSDELVYRLSSANEEDVVYGIVSFQNWRIETFPLPPVPGISSSTHNDIVFVNENVGFIARGHSLMRTDDGGRHWISVEYPGDDNFGYVTLFEDLFFLDERVGFVAFSQCLWFDACDGGWWMTTDGGDSWARTYLDRSVTSIFFISRSTGFMSTTKTYLDPNPEQTILKTVDEGKSWETIATSQADQDLNKIHIAKNEQDGYAFGGRRIHVTTDGGKSWTLFFANESIGSVAVTQDNVVCASLNTGYAAGSLDAFVSSPSRIVRCEDRATWTPVIDFQHPILELGLSPSGDLGIALGVRGRSVWTTYGQSGTVNYTYIPTISTSVDKGKTWKEIPTAALEGYPLAVDVTSQNVAYILFFDKVVKYYQY